MDAERGDWCVSGREAGERRWIADLVGLVGRLCDGYGEMRLQRRSRRIGTACGDDGRDGAKEV